MGRISNPDATQHDEAGFLLVGEKAMLEALESVRKAVEDECMTPSDYSFKFTTANCNKQAGSCNTNGRSRSSPSYEQDLSVEMVITVKTAFEAVENGTLKEGGYYFELTTPYFQFTSGHYPKQDKDESARIDDTQEPVPLSHRDYLPRLDAVWECNIMIIPRIKTLFEVEWLRLSGSKKKIPRQMNMSCIRFSIRIILVASVLMGHTEASQIATEEQPLTLTAGENGIIPFACRNEQQSAPKYYTVKFEEKDRPFYIDGTFDPEGLMSPDQAERFRVEYLEEGSSMSVEINITSVSIEDQGTYIVLLIIQGVTNEYRLMERVVLILIPPGPAICFIMLSKIQIKKYQVHCHAKPGNGNSTLTCFQNGKKIPYQGDVDDTQIVYKRIFWLMNQDKPVSCCSHDTEEIKTITQMSCDQYRYPRIVPVNGPVSPVREVSTKMPLTTRPLSIEEKMNQPSPETTSYSGCGSNFDWPTVMLPLMALFTYVCIMYIQPLIQI